MSYVNFDNEPLMFNNDFIIRESTLTLLTNGNGTLSADKLTGMPGDTVVLVPTNSSYYRLNSYSVTGGTIENNVFTFGYTDATACANFGANYFTATGSFVKGGNVSTNAYWTGDYYSASATVPANYDASTNAMLYGIVDAYTGDIPSSWHIRNPQYPKLDPPYFWRPTNAHNYSITAHPKMKFSGYVPGSTVQLHKAAVSAYTISSVNSNKSKVESASFISTGTGNYTWLYDKTFTSDLTSYYFGLSANLCVYHNFASHSDTAPSAIYIASGTTGTWTATGIAP